MAMSKPLCAPEISKKLIPEPDTYIRKDLTLVIENLNPNCVMDYVRYHSKTAVRVDNIKSIVGGHNMVYPCIELDQAQGVYEICKSYLLKTLQDTERPIMYFSEQQDINSKMTVAITNRKASRGYQSRLIFWGCLLLEINDTIPVGFAWSFDLPNKYNLNL